MERRQSGGPADGEEPSSSPSVFSGAGKAARKAAAGFADGGPADVMPAGPVLAGLVEAVTGGDGTALRGLTCQEVLGVLAAGGRIAAWAGWVQTVALAEFARRRPAAMSGSKAGREAAEEAAWKTAETWARMRDQLGWAVTMTGRLPRTLEAMRGGQLSEYKAKIIEAQRARARGRGAGADGAAG